VGAIENPSVSSGSQVFASEESSSSNPIVGTSSGLSFSSGAGRQFQGVELAIDPEVEVELGEGCVLVSDLLVPPANLRELFEDLQYCAIFDLFKTVIFPESFTEGRSKRVRTIEELPDIKSNPRHFRVGQHRGETQVIFASTAELLADLAHSGVVYIGLTFIGKGSFRKYVDALKRSHIHRLLPIIVVVTRRESKAILAKRIGASIAFDDQYDHIARYRREGIRAYQVNSQWGLESEAAEIRRLVRWYCLGKED